MKWQDSPSCLHALWDSGLALLGHFVSDVTSSVVDGLVIYSQTHTSPFHHQNSTSTNHLFGLIGLLRRVVIVVGLLDRVELEVFVFQT